MKKVLAVLAVATCFAVGTASANTYTVACTFFGNSVPSGFLANNFTASGSLSCPGISGMGSLSSLTASVLIGTDFTGANPALSTDSVVTTYSSTLSGFVTDTLTASTNPSTSTTTYTQSGILASGSTIGSQYANFFVDASGSLLGGYDPAAGYAGFSVSYATGASGGNGSVGQVQGESGQVYVQYNYTPAGSAPEPVSMLLLGSGLLGVAVIGRKFARK